MKILQFGLGRWGENHQRILTQMGHQVESHDIEGKWWSILECEHDQVDAVVITTSSENHWPIAQYAMYLGLPCFVEKPVLLKRNQLEELRRYEDKKLMMAGHQYLFLPEITQLKGVCHQMLSSRNSRNPRSEGVLFALMVQDIAIAHYVCGVEWFECTKAVGNLNFLSVELEHKSKRVELHATFNGEHMGCQFFYYGDGGCSIPQIEYSKVDLLKKELEAFCAYVSKAFPIKFNGTTMTIQVMETIFKIQDKLEERL